MVAHAEEIEFAYIHTGHMAYDMNGTPVGRTVELARIACKRLNIIPIFLDLPFARALMEIKTGQVSCFISIFKTKKRQEYLYYPAHSDIYNEMVVFARTGDAGRFKSMKDLAGKSVGAVRGYHYGKGVLDQSRIKISFVKDEETLYKMLDEGRFDAILGNRATGAMFLKDLNSTVEISVAFTTLRKPVYLAFSKHLGERGRILADRFGQEISRLVIESGGQIKTVSP